MRIVLLGASGQIGTRIQKQLHADYPAAEIISCSRKKETGLLSFDPFKDNWNRIGKADVIINSIGIIRETKNMSFSKAHVGLTHLILENRERLGHPRIIQLSVLGADRTSHSQFLNTKGEADLILLQHENTVVVRPSIVCTTHTMIVQKFKMLKKLSHFFMGHLPFPAAVLETKIQPIMGEDLASIISNLCINQAIGIVEAGGPEQITLDELLRVFARIKPFPVNQKLADRLIGFITILLPGIINRDQYFLLKANNVLFNHPSIIGVKNNFRSTREFWHKALR